MNPAFERPAPGLLSARLLLGAAVTIGLIAGLGLITTRPAAESVHPIPAPAFDAPPSQATSDVTVVAGGCFWGVQGVFQHVKGVTRAVSGYAGGDRASAAYPVVSLGVTSHAEAVEITFDPRQISYGRILQVFFSVAHHPTELNRQGPDRGRQYRSAVFPQNTEQARIAQAYIDQLDQARAFSSSIVTTIEPGHAFHPAEDYHQDFLARNPGYPYVVVNDLPKLEALKRLFPDLYRAAPVPVGGAR